MKKIVTIPNDLIITLEGQIKCKAKHKYADVLKRFTE